MPDGIVQASFAVTTQVDDAQFGLTVTSAAREGSGWVFNVTYARASREPQPICSVASTTDGDTTTINASMSLDQLLGGCDQHARNPAILLLCDQLQRASALCAAVLPDALGMTMIIAMNESIRGLKVNAGIPNG